MTPDGKLSPINRDFDDHAVLKGFSRLLTVGVDVSFRKQEFVEGIQCFSSKTHDTEDVLVFEEASKSFACV